MTMRAIVISMILLISTNALANRWPDGEITVYIDSSVANEIGDGAYQIIEDAFLEWNDAIPADVRINIVHDDCSPIYGYNCIKMIDTEDDYLMRTYQTTLEGIVSDADIFINRAFEYSLDPEQPGFNFKRLMLHEAGHFLAGLPHSEDKNDVMYGWLDYNGPMAELNDTNRYDIAAEYADTADMNCSIAPHRGGISILNLIF